MYSAPMECAAIRQYKDLFSLRCSLFRMEHLLNFSSLYQGIVHHNRRPPRNVTGIITLVRGVMALSASNRMLNQYVTSTKTTLHRNDNNIGMPNRCMPNETSSPLSTPYQRSISSSPADAELTQKSNLVTAIGQVGSQLLRPLARCNPPW